MTLRGGERLAAAPVVAVSPDGRYIAYVANNGSVSQIYLRPLDRQQATPVTATQGGTGPFFSPDSQWLGFQVGGTLRKVAISGGASVTVADGVPLGPGQGGSTGFTWAGNSIIFGSPAGLQEVPDSGGTARPLARLEEDDGGFGHQLPAWIPDADAVLFITQTLSSGSRVSVYSTRTGERRNLIQGGTSARYVPSGHLVYAQGGTLLAVAFDANRLEITGTPVPIVDGVQQINATAFYDISATGTLVYVSGPTLSGTGVVATGPRSLVWVSRTGVEQPLAAVPREYNQPRLSPDGSRMAVEIGPQIWTYNIARGTSTRLTLEGTQNDSPVWTPDAKRIAFRSNKEGSTRIFWQLADGSGGQERLTSTRRRPAGHLLRWTSIGLSRPGSKNTARHLSRVASRPEG